MALSLGLCLWLDFASLRNEASHCAVLLIAGAGMGRQK